MIKNILLTGGAGFIGSHTAETLISQGHHLTIVDNFDPFYPEAIKRNNLNEIAAIGQFDFINCDISDTAQLEQALSGKQFDAIIHLAAKAGVRPSIEDPVGYLRVNVTGTQNLLEYARKNDIRQFVFASSSSVYGVNENTPWSESDYVLKPISPYASTKVSGELLGHVYSHLYGIRFVALRFFTVFGPRQRPDLAIHKFYNLISQGKEIPVFGDGSTRRDYTYVADTVSGIVNALTYSASMFEVINLGNSETISLAEMIEAIERVTGKKANRKVLPEQPGDVPITFADISKAKELLHYNPQTPFLEGIKAFHAWKAK